MAHAPTSRRGFTLVEVLIVVVILAIVAGLSYPTITGTMARQRLFGASQEGVQLLQFARFQAVLRGRAQVVRVELAANRPGGRIEVLESRTAACADVVEDAVRVMQLDEWDEGDVGLVGAAPAGVEAAGICFKPDGKAYDAASALPPSMGDDDQRSYNVPRGATFALRFRRYAAVADEEVNIDVKVASVRPEGGVLQSVGVRREVLLPHLGVARINNELAEEEVEE